MLIPIEDAAAKSVARPGVPTAAARPAATETPTSTTSWLQWPRWPLWPLWQLGFRPFYLLAAIFSALSIALWAAQYGGLLPLAYLHGPIWHAHEMLFGFTLAVMTGFLFTAVRNWTAQPTPTGLTLAGIAALWVAGRVLVLTPWGVAAAVVNAAFPLAAAIGIGVPLARSGHRRNAFFVALLVLLSIAILATHFGQLGVIDLPPWAGIRVALDVVLFVIAVIGGRVIPMFTNHAIPRAQARKLPIVERAALGATLLLLATDVVVAALDAPRIVTASVLGVAALAHAVRLVLWNPQRTLRVPLVWILHAGYAWIPLHLALRALAEYGLVAAPLSTHALTIGAIGALTIGMMTRTALGHTGRVLRADAFDVTGFGLVLGAGLVRVFLPMAVAGAYLGSVVLSALLWSSGFALYAVHFWPILTRPRVDGRAG